MGFPVQPNAPKITVDGTTYAIGAAGYMSVVGQLYGIGVYKQDAVQGWVNAAPEQSYGVPGLLKDVQAKGGIVNYCAWIIAHINAQLATLFAGSVPPPPTGEPTTDAEAIAAIAARINALKLTLVNGVPVLQ